MHNRTAIALTALSLPLAACNSSPSVKMENASVGDVANEMAAAGGTGSFVRPGKWESKLTIEEMSMPGMPPGMANQMQEFTARIEPRLTCLSPQDVERPKEDFFAGANKNCRYDRFTMSGGKIDAVMKCTEEGGSQLVEMAGTYSPDSYSMAMSSTASGKGSSAGMKMRMRVDAKRLGECDGTEAKG